MGAVPEQNKTAHKKGLSRTSLNWFQKQTKSNIELLDMFFRPKPVKPAIRKGKSEPLLKESGSGLKDKNLSGKIKTSHEKEGQDLTKKVRGQKQKRPDDAKFSEIVSKAL